MMSFLSCSHSDEGSSVENEPVETVTLLISVPKSVNTRADVGDPGEAVREGEDWDEMAVIIAYTEIDDEPANKPVIIKTLTKDDFETLRHYNGNEASPYRMYPIDLRRGTVHIYGITYTGLAADSPKDAIAKCSTEEDVLALTISNSYALGDAGQTEKFLSVATGYYQKDDGGLAEYDISANNPIYGELAKVPSMRLTRLAAKIDIQWDAQDAYTQGYTDVGVEGFEYVGGATFDTGASDMEKKGKGRLFPDLYTGTEVLNGSSTVLNQIPISKRNGRVYHYVFPDGASQPKVIFTLSGTKNGNTVQNNYTFQFPDKIQKSTWYKVNTTIRGVTGTTTITLNN